MISENISLVFVILKQGKVCVHRQRPPGKSEQKTWLCVLIRNWEREQMEQGIDEPVNESSLSDLSVLIYSILLSKLCISNTVISDIYRQKKKWKKTGTNYSGVEVSKGSEIAFTSADISDVTETILREE